MGYTHPPEEKPSLPCAVCGAVAGGPTSYWIHEPYCSKECARVAWATEQIVRAIRTWKGIIND